MNGTFLIALGANWTEVRLSAPAETTASALPADSDRLLALPYGRNTARASVSSARTPMSAAIR